MPLAFLETSTLYVENLWLAFLLGTLLLALDWMRTRAQRHAGGRSLPRGRRHAVQGHRRHLAAAARRLRGLVGVARGSHRELHGARMDAARRRRRHRRAALCERVDPHRQPGLPVHERVVPVAAVRHRHVLQQSAVQRAAAAMEPYEMVWSSGRFIEGSDGAAGFHWLLLYPADRARVTRRPPLAFLALRSRSPPSSLSASTPSSRTCATCCRLSR